MSKRRPIYSHVRCSHAGCGETAHFHYDTQADRREADLRRQKHPYLCTRHSRPDEVLSKENTKRTTVLVCSIIGDYGNTYWVPEGGTSGSGFTHGPGFKAYTEDFPVGTRIIVTAEVQLP